MKEYLNYSLLSHNTFGVEAKCDRFLEFSSTADAVEVASQLRHSDSDLLIIGSGSNLLLTGDFKGIVVHSAIAGIEDLGHCQIKCGSGVLWDDVVDYCVNHHLYGAENLSIIPGEVGASAVQNIGAYGAEASDLIVEVEAVEISTGKVCLIPKSECHYAYRQSRFKQEWRNKYLVTHVTYQLSDTFSPRLDYGNIRAKLAEKGISNPSAADLRKVVIDIRNAKLPDPKVQGNAGSFFMNPIVSRQTYEQLAERYPAMPHYTIDADHEKIPAGWMIDQCGWKGKALGRAGVHDKQALVLVNLGGAKGEDVVNLCNAIRKDVKTRFGITIYPEVNIR